MFIKIKVYYYEIETEGNFLDAKMIVQVNYPEAEERLYVTTSKDVMFLDADYERWQSLWRGILQKGELNEDYPAILKNLGAGGTLILANDNKVHTLIATANNTTESDENRLVFDSIYFINWVRVTSSAVFIGLQHKQSELLPSQIVHYEPFGERTRIFTIEEGATMGFIINENCHILDKSGQIRYFTGSSFQPYQYFPPYYRNEKITKLPHRNGVITKDESVKFLWEGQYPDPAGVWILEDGNLYHKHSLVFDKENLNSLGALEVSELRALYEEDEIFMGAGVQNGLEAIIEGIYSTIKSEDTEVDDEQRCHFITSKFISPEIDSIWQDIVLKYDPKGQEGYFIVKHRIEPARITEGVGAVAFNGEWTAYNIFTCSDAEFVSAVNDDNIKVGDEVIIRKGQGAGLLVHITEITGTTTKTITTDEGLTAITSGKFTFSVEAWQKINFNFKNTKSSEKASLKDKRLEQAQFKIDMRRFVLEEIQVLSITDKTIQKR